MKWEELEEKYGTSKKKPSRLWYLAPVFLGIIGGLVGYIVVHDENEKMAKKLLIVGLIVTGIWIVISFISPILLTMWLTSYVKTGTETIW